jgi:hypothetical protein
MSAEEVNALIQSYMQYLAENPYATVDAEINGAPCTVIAAVESKEMQQVQPLFIIPSPELILHVVDIEDKKPIFGIAANSLN